MVGRRDFVRPSVSSADRHRWDEKHRTGAGNQPNASLVRFADLLPRRGRVLDLACGTGSNALFLAARLDARVDAVDVSGVALASLCSAATSARLESRIQPMQIDLDQAAFRVDCARYDAITIVSFLARPLFPLLSGLLRPGGFLFIETFDRSYLDVNPRFSSQYVLEPSELLHALSAFEVLHHATHAGRATFLGKKPPSAQMR